MQGMGEDALIGCDLPILDELLGGTGGSEEKSSRYSSCHYQSTGPPAGSRR